MFIRRTRQEGDPYLPWKLRSFAFGAALGLAGIFFDSGWLIGIALGVLGVGFVLRFAADGEEDEESVEAGGS